MELIDVCVHTHCMYQRSSLISLGAIDVTQMKHVKVWISSHRDDDDVTGKQAEAGQSMRCSETVEHVGQPGTPKWNAAISNDCQNVVPVLPVRPHANT